MDVKQLSSTSIKLPVIGQGAGSYSWNETHINVLRKGIDLGMNFIDTAENYDDGRSEEIIGKAIKDIRKKVIIGTKFSPEHSSYQKVLRAVECSLKRLKTDYIDLYQMHWPNPNVPFEETLRAMEQLVKWGKVRYIGLSNVYLTNLQYAHSKLIRENLASLQIEYNLFDRTVEDNVLDFCKRNEIMLIAFSPLSTGGIMYGKKQRESLYKIAAKYGRTPVQIILRWLTSKPNIVTIVKAMNIKHLEENATSINFDIEKEDIDFIDKNIKGTFKLIQPDRINVDKDNLDKFVPHPKDLIEYIHKGETLKPIRVITTKDISGKYDYDLVEGKFRYWVWVMSDYGKSPIRALIKE